MNDTARKTRNWTYLIVMTIVRAVYMPGALIISFGHIISLGESLGLTGWQAFTAPLFIDGFAVLGMIGRSHKFADTTRRWAFWMQTGAGAVSLLANVFAGHNAGERIYGALVVFGFVVAERFAERAYAAPPTPAGPTAEEIAAAELAEKRSEAGRKAAATKKANKETAEKLARIEARRQRRQVRELETAFNAADAPVSPAPAGTAA